MRLILLYLAIIVNTSLFAQIKQEIELNTQYFNTKNGLPNSFINFTFQDKYGYIWIGTNAGLSKYNGYQFKNFLPDPNQDGNIQVGQYTSYLKISDTIYYLSTYSDGLIKLNIHTNRIEKIKNSPSSITYIIQDKDATFWIGTFSAGVYHYYPSKNKFVQTLLKPLVDELYDDLNNNTVSSIIKDTKNDSNLWLGTRIGLVSFNKISKKTEYHKVLHSNLAKEQALNRIISMCYDDNGNIWVGRLKGGGLGKFNIKNRTWTNFIFNEEDFNKKGFSSNSITNIYKYSNSKLILSTDLGLLSFELKNNEFIKFKLKNDIEIFPSANHLLIDKDSNWWISHNYSGLSFINPKLNAIKTIQLPPQKFKPDENKSLILDFYFSKKHQKYFMLNTNHDGLTIYDKAFKLIQQVTLPNYWEKFEPFPISLGEDDEGMIWINEYSDKLFVYNPFNNEVKNYENTQFTRCFQIYRSPNNILYFKTENGLYSLKNKIWKLEINAPPWGEKHVNIAGMGWVSNVKDSFLFFEINDSVFRFDLKSKAKNYLFSLPNFATKNNNHIWQIYIDSKNRVWFPMELGGVYRYDLQSKKGMIYSGQKGLSSNTAHLVKEDKNGTVFLIGKNGLYYYNETQDRFIDFGNLSSNTSQTWFKECLFFTEKDELLLCKNDEFSLVNKNLILKQTNDNLPVITSIFGNSFCFFHEIDNIEIPNYENDLTIEISSFDYSNISEILYAYKLDNNSWINLDKGLNKISLNNLSEGKHLIQFKILGSIKVSKCTIIIKEKWHKSKLFYWVVTLFLLVIAAYFLWFYLNRKNKEKELKTRIAELKLLALQSQLNPHFLFNCLTSISGLIKTKEYDKSELILNDFAKLMRSILTNSSKDLISLDEEIKISKLYLDIEQVRKNNNFEYEFKIGNLSLLDKKIPPLILQPFLENCIKHGFEMKSLEEKGLINIEINKKNQGLQIIISDNGIGVKENNQIIQNHQSMGIKIQKERLIQYSKTHNMSINIETEFIKNHGAEIKITIQ